MKMSPFPPEIIRPFGCSSVRAQEKTGGVWSFPPSVSAVTEESLQTAGLSHQEYALISEESQPYTIRFKAVEWWEACKHWFSRNES